MLGKSQKKASLKISCLSLKKLTHSSYLNGFFRESFVSCLFSSLSMRLLLFFLFLLVGPSAISQVPLILDGSLKKPQLELTAYTWFYEDDSADSLSLSLIQTKTFRPWAEKLNNKTSFSTHSRSII